MRIAFYGGSFDPPHLGHLRIAQAAADRLQLDKVLIAPVALQPLKSDGPAPASYADRLAMLDLLLREVGDLRLVTSELDEPRPENTPNYTYDTITRLREALTPEDHLFALTGADALVTLPHWHRALDLVQAVDFIVAARPGFPLARLSQCLLLLVNPGVLRPGVLDLPGVQHLVLLPGATPSLAPSARLRSQSQANFYLLPDLDEDISSTSIRTSLAASPDAATSDLSPTVAAYIRAHALYR